MGILRDKINGKDNGKTPAPTIPSDDQIAAWVVDSVCEAVDGCTVEPDGHCPHGSPSWLIQLGIM
jgi:hypothetical protein